MKFFVSEGQLRETALAGNSQECSHLLLGFSLIRAATQLFFSRALPGKSPSSFQVKCQITHLENGGHENKNSFEL